MLFALYKLVDLLLCYFRSRRGGGVRSFAALLDPPRQAVGLRMAYGIPYPNLLALPFFLMAPFLF